MARIKNNRIFRGLYFWLKNYFGIKRTKWGYCGKQLILNPPYYINNPSNLYIHNNVSIGSGFYITATNAKVVIKSSCVIAEHLTIHTGNHARIIGVYVNDVTEKNKPEGFDKDVVVENDVWIGCNVTLLSGVTIGRGATIAAGAVVNKSIPSYCIAGGVPAKFIKFYWTIDQILEHESKTYPKEERYTRAQLEEIFDKWQK